MNKLIFLLIVLSLIKLSSCGTYCSYYNSYGSYLGTTYCSTSCSSYSYPTYSQACSSSTVLADWIIAVIVIFTVGPFLIAVIIIIVFVLKKKNTRTVTTTTIVPNIAPNPVYSNQGYSQNIYSNQNAPYTYA